jgi:hypothetical protein
MQIVHLARQIYPENISSFHKTYLDVCKDPHTYLFLDLKQTIKDLLMFRTKIFPDKITKVFAPVVGNEALEITAISSRLKYAKPLVRRPLLTSASDELTKVIVECAINKLSGNHKLSKENGKLRKYKNRLSMLVNPKISIKSKRKLLIQRGGFIVPLLTSILSGVVGAIINNNRS